VLEFAWGTDMDQASLEVRDKLETLQLPFEVEPPVLLRFNPSTEPVLRIALSAAGEGDEIRQLTELRRYADDELKRRLESVPGVAAIRVGGGLEDEIQVDLDLQQLARIGLPPGNVIQRLQQENINLSGGRLEQGTQRYLVRTVNQFASVDEIRNMLVTTQSGSGGGSGAEDVARIAAASGDASVLAAAMQAQSAAAADNRVAADGRPVRLGDIATVRQGYKEREAIIRLAGREAVELAVYKEGDANTVATADAVHARIAELRERLPADIGLTVVDDQSKFIRAAISDVKVDAVFGGTLAILVIFLFLRSGWSTLVVGVSLPVSIVATFFFMDRLGLSLNVMSLGGLALATGLVVDDSIAVLAGIATPREGARGRAAGRRAGASMAVPESGAKARARGRGVIAAALAGRREVGRAGAASTLPISAVFRPLVFLEGIAGQLLGDQGLPIALGVG